MAVNPNDATEVVPYLTSAATIVFIQKWLKTRNFYQQFVTAFPGADKWAHWIAAGFMSLVAAAGIHLTWSYDPNAGGTFSGTLPDIMTMVHGVSDWFKVYILQHTIHGSQYVANYDMIVDAVVKAMRQEKV